MKSRPLKTLVDVTAGQGAPKQDEFSHTGIPFIRAGSLEGLLNGKPESSLELVSPEIAERRKLKLYNKGSILFAKSGISATKSRIYIIQDSVYVVSHLAILVPHNNVSSEYIKHALRHYPPSSLIKDPAYPAISLDEIENFSIPTPNRYDDQKRIAYLLDTVEGLIQTRKKHLQVLEALRQSIFMEMFGDAINSKRSKRKSLSSISSVISGVAKGKRYKEKVLIDMPYMRVANVQDGYLDLSEIKHIGVSPNDAKIYELKKDDLLLTEGGDPDKLGRGSIWKAEIEPCIFQNHIFCVRVTSENEIIPAYLSALVGSRYGKSYFLRSAKQTTGIASINSTQLKAFPVVLPPLPLQKQFAAIVEKVEGIKAMYQKSLVELENIYGALSQKAFRGELDLTRVPLPVIMPTFVDNAQTREVAQISQCTVEDFVKFGYSAAQFVHKLAEVIAPLLAPLLIALNAAGRGYRQGVEEFQVTSTTSKTIPSKSIHVTKKKLSGGEAQQGIWNILNRFIFEELGDVPFSAQEFVDAVRQELGDITDDPKSTQELSILLYEQVKLWIFDSIKNNKLEQFFNAQENTVSFRRVSEQ